MAAYTAESENDKVLLAYDLNTHHIIPYVKWCDTEKSLLCIGELDPTGIGRLKTEPDPDNPGKRRIKWTTIHRRFYLKHSKTGEIVEISKPTAHGMCS